MRRGAQATPVGMQSRRGAYRIGIEFLGRVIRVPLRGTPTSLSRGPLASRRKGDSGTGTGGGLVNHGGLSRWVVIRS